MYFAIVFSPSVVLFVPWPVRSTERRSHLPKKDSFAFAAIMAMDAANARKQRAVAEEAAREEAERAKEEDARLLRLRKLAALEKTDTTKPKIKVLSLLLRLSPLSPSLSPPLSVVQLTPFAVYCPPLWPLKAIRAHPGLQGEEEESE
jgi:hypothetical protein